MIQIHPTFLVVILPLFLIDVAVPTATKECLSPWIPFNQSCYRIGPLMLKWHTSQVICMMNGAKLVEIETAAENEFVVKKMKEFQTGAIWTGGTDAFSERTWTWFYSTRPIVYTDWYNSNPSYTDGVEHCIEIRPAGGFKWNDIRCDILNSFVCEQPILSVHGLL